MTMAQHADLEGASHPSITPPSRARNLAFPNETPAGSMIATPNQAPREVRLLYYYHNFSLPFALLGHDSVRDRTGKAESPTL